MSTDTQTLAPPAPAPGSVAASLVGRPLGELLVAQAGLAPEKLEEALAAQQGEQAGQRLGEILVRMKAATEEQVLRALAIQLDLPFLAALEAAEVPEDLARLVPINFAK